MALLRNKNAEEDLIGILLRSPDQILELNDLLTVEDFTEKRCADIFRALLALTMECKVISKAAIAQRSTEEELPLILYMSSLAAKAPQMGVVEAAEIVEDASIRRRATEIMNSGMKGLELVADPGDVLQVVQSGVLDLIGRKVDRGNRIDVIAANFYATSGQADSRKVILRTGLDFVDEIFGPMMSGDMIVLGGATSSGKTALARQMAFEIAQQGIPVLYLTKEMSATQIVIGLFSQITGIPNERIETDAMNAAERGRLMDAQAVFRNTPMRVEDLPKGATVSTALARALYNSKKYGAQFVIVDDLHKLKSDEKTSDRFARIESVAMGLKEAAKQTYLPWLCLAHVNRDLNKRQGNRPKMEDLFGGSEIEKSADVVAFIHRQQYWLEKSEPAREEATRAQWETDMRRWQGRAEIIVEKRRRGKGSASRECQFVEEATLFRALRDKTNAKALDGLNSLETFGI